MNLKKTEGFCREVAKRARQGRAVALALAITAALISNVYAQGSGTPSTLRVKVDANNYLILTAAAQTNPVSNPTVFNQIRLKTDSNGYLFVVVTGAITPTTISCNGSIGTTSTVLVGGTPCSWSSTPSLTSLTLGTGTSGGQINASANNRLDLTAQRGMNFVIDAIGNNDNRTISVYKNSIAGGQANILMTIKEDNTNSKTGVDINANANFANVNPTQNVAPLNVYANSSTLAAPTFNMEDITTWNAVGGQGPVWSFKGQVNTGSTSARFGSIQASKSNGTANNYLADLIFYTNHGASTTDLVEGFRITNTGVAQSTIFNATTELQQNGVAAALGVAASYKIARGSTALDGTNPTTTATGLTTVVSCTGTLLRNSALTSGTAFLTHDTASGANVDWYGWIIAGTASSGTENFEWVCVGT